VRTLPLQLPLAALVVTATATASLAGKPAYGIFRHTVARLALQKARDECKPLVIHVVPTARRGRRQIKEYSGRKSSIPRDVLEGVVVLVVPRDKYPDFVHALGLNTDTGLCSLSPYGLAHDSEGRMETAEYVTVQWTEHRVIRQCGPRARDMSLAPQIAGCSTLELRKRLQLSYPEHGLPTRHVNLYVGQFFRVRNMLRQPRYLEIAVPVERCGRTYWERPAEQASAYFEEVCRYFEEAIAEGLDKPLTESTDDETSLLGRIRLIQRRGITGFESELRGLLSSRRRGALGREVHRASLEALLTTDSDRASLARYLAYVSSLEYPACGRELCVAGLRELRPEADNEILAYLGRTQDRLRRRRLALLLGRVTRVPSPQPLRFWERAGESAVADAVRTWSTEIEDRSIRRKANRR
jgi:hypothetical protein